MPELPEVQTVIDYLKKEIIGLKIKQIEIKNEKFLKNTAIGIFKQKLINKKIVDIKRKGKYLIFELDNSLFMVVHLRMEGKFFVDQKKINRKHDYLIFDLTEKFLAYNDSRQFGTFHLTDNIEELKELKKVAIDPLDDKFDVNYLKNKLDKLRKEIKVLLLDQTIVSGIGNIYASEILFDAKISPFKKANELSMDELERIVVSSKKILKLALKYNGTTIHTFSFGENKTGEFNKLLKVMNQANKKCYICSTNIVRIKQQSRSTFYCPQCQK